MTSDAAEIIATRERESVARAKISAAQANREKPARRELDALVRPLAAHLPKALAPSEGQPQVSNEQRAVLREIPPEDLAAAVVRAVIGLLWRRKRNDNTGKWESDLTVEHIQTVWRGVGLRVLQAYMRVQSPQLSPRLADLKLEEMRHKLTLRHVTEIGLYLTEQLHRTVGPGLLLFHPSRLFIKKGKGKPGKKGKEQFGRTDHKLSLDPDAAARFGFPTLLAACDHRPMIEPPLPWGRFRDRAGNEVEPRGGYRYRLKGSVPLITNVPASEADPPCSPIVYEALNALQETPWRVNLDVLTVAQAEQERLKPEYNAICDEWRPLAAKKKRTSKEAARFEKLTAEKQHLEADQSIVAEAENEADEEVLYFVHSLDYRGRVYAHGRCLFPGGLDLARALLTFAHGRQIAAHDTEAMQVTIQALDTYGADCLGAPLDPEEVARIGENPVETRPLWWKAKKNHRWQYLAYCLEHTALINALAAGLSYESRLPVWQDASSNGLQHMALLIRDEELGKKVGIVPLDHDEERKNIYDEVAKKMTARLAEKDTKRRPHMNVANRKALLKHCGGEVKRNHAKSPTMTFGYGGVWLTFYDNFAIEELGMRRDDSGRVPWNPLAACFATVAWETLKDDAAPRAVELRDWFQQVAKVIAKTDEPATWVVPGTGFPAGQRHSRTSETARLRFDWDGIERWITVPVQEFTMLNPDKHRTSFAPNVTHSLDAAHLMLTVAQARDNNFDGPLGTIHDSFAACAADAPVLEHFFKSGFDSIYSSKPKLIDDHGDIVSENIKSTNNPLLNLADQFRGQCPDDEDFPEPPRQGTLDVNRVYAACPLGEPYTGP